MKLSNIIGGILLGLAILQLIQIAPLSIYVIRTAIEREFQEGQR